ncbi:MAG TPA: amidohydrolase family protein [Sphingobium sp.]|nr:amidohydrolase family protein [Sphingobium sp.]
MPSENSAPRRTGRLIATEEAFLTQSWLDAMAGLSPDGPSAGDLRFLGLLKQIPMWHDGLFDWNKRLADMDASGLDMHVLSVASPGVQTFDPQVGAQLATAMNDTAAEMIARYPTRFAALGAIAPQNPEASAREIERIARDLRFGGLIINSHTNDEFLDRQHYEPVLAAAVAHKMPIYLHPRGPAPSMMKPFIEYGLMAATWGFAADAGLHAMRLIMSGTFDRHPDLTIVLGHLGEAIPFFLDRIDFTYDTALRTGKSKEMGFVELKKKPSQYFRDNFYITTSGMGFPDVIDYCIKVMGSERMMFAVDYPYHDTEHAVDFMRSTTIDDQDWHNIAHATAERVFNIAPAA